MNKEERDALEARVRSLMDSEQLAAATEASIEGYGAERFG